MNPNQTIPAGADFRAAVADAMREGMRVMAMLLDSLPDKGQETLAAVVAGGGRGGVELTVDRAGVPRAGGTIPACAGKTDAAAR